MKDTILLLIAKLFCLIQHDYEIHKMLTYNGKFKHFIRVCMRRGCCKEQVLTRPEKYHPCKYIWEDIKGEE